MRGGLSTVGRDIRMFGTRMRRVVVRRSRGFTIIEVLIVLAVTGALFVSAVILISGRQARTAFEQASRQVQSQIQQVLNEVSTGFYPNNGSVACTAGASGAPPVLSTATSDQGSNTDCIFVGKALQFKVASTDPEVFAVYTIAGLKRGTGGESSSLSEARPIVVAPSSPSHTAADYPDNTVEMQLQHGLTVARMWYRDDVGADHDIGALAFVNGLANYGGSGELLSGASRVDVVAVDNSSSTTGLGLSKPVMAEALNSDGGNRLANGILNPGGGIFICFESGGTQDYAVVRIGGESRDLTVALNIIDKVGTTCTYP